jgi:hypothetical protein
MAGISGGSGDMKPEKFEEMLRPKLIEFQKELELGFGKLIMKQIEEVKAKMTTLNESINSTLEERLEEVVSTIDTKL